MMRFKGGRDESWYLFFQGFEASFLLSQKAHYFSPLLFFFLTRPRLSRSAYKLPPLTLAILSLLGLVALMLLACLLSCLYKVHKRNEKNKKLMLIAQQAGKSDGEAFRQVTSIVLYFSWWCKRKWAVGQWWLWWEWEAEDRPAPAVGVKMVSWSASSPPVLHQANMFTLKLNRSPGLRMTQESTRIKCLINYHTYPDISPSSVSVKYIERSCS